MKLPRLVTPLSLAMALWIPGAVHAQRPLASPDSIVAVVSRLSGETGPGPDSRFAPRPSTADHIAWLRAELQRRLEPLGGYAVLDTFSAGFTSPEESLRQIYTNVVGVLPGTAGPGGQGCYMFGAHLDATSQRDKDSTPGWDPLTAPAPGADDNGSGVAAVLEAARVLAERNQRPVVDLLFVLFDGEEQQLFDPNKFLLGSAHLADSLAEADKKLYGFVNLDMVGYNPDGTDSLVVMTNGKSRWLADSVCEANGGCGDANDLALTRVVRGLGFSDHGPFWEAGYDAVLLIEAIDIARYAPHYHKATDTVANVYLDGGSQNAAATNLLLNLVDQWSATGDPEWTMTPEDLFVAKGLASDVSTVVVDELLLVSVGFTNRGGPSTGAGEVRFHLETPDGTFLRELGRRPVSLDFPPGGRGLAEQTWTVAPDEAGAVRLVATLYPDGELPLQTSRIYGVEQPGAGIVRAYVYPNPTMDPNSATFHYELAQGGPIRLSILDLQGNLLGTQDKSFDPVFPGDAVDVGVAQVELRELLSVSNLAPGLYMARVELFSASGGVADVRVVKFAVVR